MVMSEVIGFAVVVLNLGLRVYICGFASLANSLHQEGIRYYHPPLIAI